MTQVFTSISPLKPWFAFYLNNFTFSKLVNNKIIQYVSRFRSTQIMLQGLKIKHICSAFNNRFDNQIFYLRLGLAAFAKC